MLTATAGVLEATTSGAAENEPATPAGEDSGGRTTSEVVDPSSAVTGQSVVESATVTVVREIEWAGQSVTVGAQLMKVET